MIEDGTMEIRPFNDNQWSKYSKKEINLYVNS